MITCRLVAWWRHLLCFVAHGDLIICFDITSTMQQHAFSVISPVTWNGFHDERGWWSFLGSFYQLLKTVFFCL